MRLELLEAGDPDTLKCSQDGPMGAEGQTGDVPPAGVAYGPSGLLLRTRRPLLGVDPWNVAKVLTGATNVAESFIPGSGDRLTFKAVDDGILIGDLSEGQKTLKALVEAMRAEGLEPVPMR